MIPRYQRVLFAAFLTASLIMAVALFHLRRSTQDRLAASMADAPLVAPSQVAVVPVKLLLASDVDDTLRITEKKLPAPASPNARARFLLQALFTEYSTPLSQHALPAGSAVEDVFFIPMDNAVVNNALDTAAPAGERPVMAVVNLDRTYFQANPSGLATEMLTLRSMVGTLHINFPQVAAVRFMLDGQPGGTLAGHADLTHIYSANEEREISADLSSDEAQP